MSENQPDKPTAKIVLGAEVTEEEARILNCKLLDRLIHDALPSPRELRDFPSSAKVWRDQARAWFFTEEPVVAKDRDWIIEIGCGLSPGRKYLEYIKEMIRTGKPYVELKRELGL